MTQKISTSPIHTMRRTRRALIVKINDVRLEIDSPDAGGGGGGSERGLVQKFILVTWVKTLGESSGKSQKTRKLLKQVSGVPTQGGQGARGGMDGGKCMEFKLLLVNWHRISSFNWIALGGRWKV